MGNPSYKNVSYNLLLLNKDSFNYFIINAFRIIDENGEEIEIYSSVECKVKWKVPQN